MKAMVLHEPGRELELRDLPTPEPGPGEVRIRVDACAVCRTDLHVVDGELSDPSLPLVPGHEIVGRIDAVGRATEGANGADHADRPDGADGRTAPDVELRDAGGRRLEMGDRVGVPWLASTCEKCRYCRSGRENLCPDAEFTGYTRDGGYAEYTVARAGYVVSIPERYDDVHAAPLLCAGLIGYRAYRQAGEGPRLGLYGFGAAAHLLAQVADHDGREIYAFTRPGDERGQAFARSLGAAWAGGSDESPPDALDAAIIFAPVGSLVPAALRAVAPGGRVVCAGIHMSEIPAFPYEILWMERQIRSVANLTREDASGFFEVAAETPIEARAEEVPLEEANAALRRLREGDVEGALVLVP